MTELSDEDAISILNLLRTKVINFGLNALDESAIQNEIISTDQAGLTIGPRDRLLSYIAYLRKYMADHSQSTLKKILADLNRQLDREPYLVSTVELELPEFVSSREYGKENRLVSFERLLFPDETIREFDKALDEINSFIVEGKFPGPEADGPDIS